MTRLDTFPLVGFLFISDCSPEAGVFCIGFNKQVSTSSPFKAAHPCRNVKQTKVIHTTTFIYLYDIYEACSEITETTAKLLECMGQSYQNLLRIILSLL